MPINLPPDALAAERKYRDAQSTAEKITTLEEFLSLIPKHKGTDKLRASLRKRLSKLKATAQASKKSTSKRDFAFVIDKEGAGQVALVGPTNVGKSTLVATLTNATPEVAASAYTTWTPTPGMMMIEDIQVQLIDTPPLDKEYIKPELMSLIRRADLILLVVDLQTDPVQQLMDTITLLKEHRIIPHRLQDRYTDQKGLTFIPLFVLANKNDDETSDENFDIFCELLKEESGEDECPLLPISATTGRNLERMKQVVFERLEIIRVYSKAPGKDPDLDAPFILKKGSTVEDFAAKVHQDFLQNLKSARVWGSAALYDGQMVRRDHVLSDGDVVELRI